jgi:hypothetical protein
LLVDPEAGGHTDLVPTLPGCTSEGDTMIRDAAQGSLALAAERGEELPAETFGTVVAEIDVPVPATVEAVA